MKFFIDVQLPGTLTHWFKKHGYDAVHALDEGFGKTDDRKTWDAALDENRIAVSKDEDFFILATRPKEQGQLLWLRIGNCRTHQLLSRLEEDWPSIAKAFESGQRIVKIR